MIKIEKVEVVGWEAAIRGMRNPMNSWDRSDSARCCDFHCSEVPCPFMTDARCRDDIKSSDFILGPNDYKLMMNLAKAGPVHAKYRRMIKVYVDITAPLYWWKEFDTYKVGTVANSCSTMHKIHAKEVENVDFSTEHLSDLAKDALEHVIYVMNKARDNFISTGDKESWYEMIQLMPAGYNQKRTIELNYEVLAGIYPMRKDHKLDEWRDFCKFIEMLPYSELITLKQEGHDED